MDSSVRRGKEVLRFETALLELTYLRNRADLYAGRLCTYIEDSRLTTLLSTTARHNKTLGLRQST